VTKRLLTLLAAIAASFLLAGAQPAHAEGGDNAAVAVNTKDGSSLFKFAFAVRHVVGDVVDQTNAAVAYASCTDCETTAIAIEIVLVESDTHTFTPTNVALAINESCTACVTFASAYQFVVSTNGPVHFTAEGSQELARIKKAIRDLKDQDLAPAALDARLHELMGQLKQVLETQLVPAGEAGDAQGGEEPSTETTEGEKTHAVTTTTTPPSTTTAPATTTAPTTTATPTTSTTPTSTTTTPTTSSTPTSTTTTTTPTTSTNATTTTTP
jgi:putative peptide zinc metalloprotease protein